ncbi:MAG: hypothetical protein IJI14_12390 [Anaerolineaceae bacterium]|nr:hypothetical protein [Anaerolineaceae bacterium]
MGRTLQSATQTWIEEEKALQRFTRALRREDQAVMKDLIHLSRLHIAESSYAGNLYPMDTYIISMLLEVAKRSERIESKVNELCRRCGVDDVPDANVPRMPGLRGLLYPDSENDDSSE